MRGEHGVDHLLLCGDSTFPVSWAIFFMGWVSTSDLYLISTQKNCKSGSWENFSLMIPFHHFFFSTCFCFKSNDFFRWNSLTTTSARASECLRPWCRAFPLLIRLLGHLGQRGSGYLLEGTDISSAQIIQGNSGKNEMSNEFQWHQCTSSTPLDTLNLTKISHEKRIAFRKMSKWLLTIQGVNCLLSLAETDQIVFFVTTSSLGSLVNWDQWYQWFSWDQLRSSTWNKEERKPPFFVSTFL